MAIELDQAIETARKALNTGPNTTYPSRNSATYVRKVLADLVDAVGARPTERDPVRAALADEFEGAIQITIRKRNEAGRVVAESLMAQHREVVVAALRAPLPGRLDCGAPVAWQMRPRGSFWQHCDIVTNDPDIEFRPLYALPPTLNSGADGNGGALPQAGPGSGGAGGQSIAGAGVAGIEQPRTYSNAGGALKASAAMGLSAGGDSPFRAGDSVLHGPSGETWVVAYVDGEYMAWCGWPEGEAQVRDCTLVTAVSDTDHINWLVDIAKADGKRGRKARAALEAMIECREDTAASWCKSHQRRMTHTINGKPHCDPALGGIMLPCAVDPNPPLSPGVPGDKTQEADHVEQSTSGPA